MRATKLLKSFILLILILILSAQVYGQIPRPSRSIAEAGNLLEVRRHLKVARFKGTITVAGGGTGDFSSLAGAYTYVAAQVRDEENQWLVLVYPGAVLSAPGSKPSFTNTIFLTNTSSTASPCADGEVQLYVAATNSWRCGSAGTFSGPGTANTGAVARYVSETGTEAGNSILYTTNGDMSGPTDYSGLASTTLGTPGAGGVTKAPCFVRFPSQFTVQVSAWAAESCTSPGIFGSADGEILSVHFADAAGQPPTFNLTSNDSGVGGGGLILAGYYDTFSQQAYRRIAWSDSDSIPALGNPVSYDTGLIRKAAGLVQVNDGTRDGTSYRDLQARRLIATTGLRVTTLTTPGSSSAPCTQGDMFFDANFVYVCVATNTLKRAALSDW